MKCSLAKVRVAIVATTGIGSMLAASPTFAQDGSQYAKAYDFALRCFVATSDRDNPVSSKTAFDAALKLAHLQGLSNAQINDDFHHAMAFESIKIGRSPQYKQQLISDCQKIGMAD